MTTFFKLRFVLCPSFRKTGNKICNDINCQCFHPRLNCKFGSNCNRKICNFIHPDDWYKYKDENIVVKDENTIAKDENNSHKNKKHVLKVKKYTHKGNKYLQKSKKIINKDIDNIKENTKIDDTCDYFELLYKIKDFNTDIEFFNNYIQRINNNI